MSEDTGGRQAKIPTWDGSADSFQASCEAALLFEQTTKFQDRYLAGPRLVGELQGAAKRLIVGQKPDWVSYNGGVEHLLQHLRRCLGKPQVPELTELLAKYFKTSKRKPGELMGEYITRKCELYVRAQQSMSRIKPHHDRTEASTGVDWPGPWNSYSRRSSVDSRASTEGVPEGDMSNDSQAAAPTAPTTGEPSETHSSSTSNTGNQNYTWNDWSWSGSSSYWNWQSYSSWNWQPRNWGSASSYSEGTSMVLPELVPEFVQAWLLLQDAGLEPHEKNTVIVATQGDMSLQRVAQELRNQFADLDIKKRDTSRKYHGYVGDRVGDSEDESPTPETSFNAETELNEEGWALWSETEDEIQTALAALQQTRRTLRDARERQKQVKQNRQYFRQGPRKSDGSHQREAHITCLKCGKTGHKAINCPQNSQQASAAEMAPFICFAQEESMDEQAWATERAPEKPTTSDAVAAGKAVIDCGATKSIGSARALEQVMKLSKHGIKKVDTQDRPRFGFGNSSEDRCISTLHLNVQAAEQPGIMRIHALNRGSGPVLLSVSTLKALGAMIDFADGTMVLRHVDANKLLTLEESQTGHLLLPLVDDLLSGAEPTQRPIPSLKSYLQVPESQHDAEETKKEGEPGSKSFEAPSDHLPIE